MPESLTDLDCTIILSSNSVTRYYSYLMDEESKIQWGDYISRDHADSIWMK